MLNKTILMGRLTKDPELRQTSNGTSVTSFSIAVESDFKGANGERKTEFFDIVAWRNTAEFVVKYFTKGRMAIVVGQLKSRSWEDSNGQPRRQTEVLAEQIYFGDSKKQDASEETPPIPLGDGWMMTDGPIDESDLPF